MTGFKAETESGVRSGFANIAKIAGVAFGAIEAFKFGKDLISGAADLQKQLEVIKTQFGDAGKEVAEFGEKGAKGLGISADTADKTAAKFGILFHNLGVAKGPAAEMTVGFIKLAGSIAAVRGVDPATLLQNLPLAAAGNIRSLKQMGIATDQTQIKIAAFKLGLTDSITQALTPAQRAMAIYAIATKNLADFQEQAKAHAGDLVNEQRRLSAAWSDGKDDLGKGLLPLMAPLVSFLADKLPAAIGVVRRGFHDLFELIRGVGKFLGPVFKPIISEISKLKEAFTKDGMAGGIAKIRSEFQKLSPAGKAAIGILAALAAQFAITVAAAFPISATVLALIALGVALKEAYDHSQRFRDIVAQLEAFLTGKVVPAIKKIAAAAAPAFAQLTVSVQHALGSLKTIFQQAIKPAIFIWQHFGQDLTKIVVRNFNEVIKLISSALMIVEGVFKFFADLLTGKWGKMWDDVKSILGTGLDAALSVASTWGNDILDLFDAVWRNVEISFLEGVQKALSILAKVPTSFKVFGHRVGFKNPAQGAIDSLQGVIDGVKSSRAREKLKDAVDSAGRDALNAAADEPHWGDAPHKLAETIKRKVAGAVHTGATVGSSQVASSATSAAVNKAEQALSGLKSKLHELIAANAVEIAQAIEDAKSNLMSLGSTLATQVGAVMDEPFNIANQKIQDATDRVAAIYNEKNAALEAQARRLAMLQSAAGLRTDTRSLSNMRAMVSLGHGRSLDADPKKALAELDALARKSNSANRPAIDKFRDDYQASLLQVEGDKLGIQRAALDGENAVKTAALSMQSDQLRVAQDASNARKKVVQQQITDLTAAMASGMIKAGTFNSKIAKILGMHGGLYKASGRTLGLAFKLGFESTAGGLMKQANALAAGPQMPGTGQEPKIIQPLKTLQQEQEKVKKLMGKIGDKQIDIQHKTMMATAKAAATLKLIHDTQIGPGPKGIGGGQSARSKALAGTGG